MIISCPNCNKKFKIDSAHIPNEGRDLQCGSCNHIWFYKKSDDNPEVLELNDEISTRKSEINEVKNKEETIIEIEKKATEIKEEKKVKILEYPKTVANSKKFENKDKGSKFFSYLIVFIISFFMLIILLDTLKTPLIKIFPGLEIILFNLFETLHDIKLFIIDLV